MSHLFQNELLQFYWTDNKPNPEKGSMGNEKVSNEDDGGGGLTDETI